MTVEQLINLLKQCDPKAIIVRQDGYDQIPKECTVVWRQERRPGVPYDTPLVEISRGDVPLMRAQGLDVSSVEDLDGSE